MRAKGSVTAFCAVTAAIGATVFASAGAQAVPLAGYSGLNTAIHSATSAQQVGTYAEGRIAKDAIMSQARSGLLVITRRLVTTRTIRAFGATCIRGKTNIMFTIGPRALISFDARSPVLPPIWPTLEPVALLT